MTGGELVIRCLSRLQVQVIFGIPGGQTLGITDALTRCPGIRFVTMRHESAAAHAADGYARTTGKVGVCLATTGPGATNLLTGVAGAWHDSSPVVALVVDNQAANIMEDDSQSIDHKGIFEHATKEVIFVKRGQSIPQACFRAFELAQDACPGPVLLLFARDAIEAPVPDVHIPLASSLQTVHRSRCIDTADVADVVDTISRWDRPAIWCGRGVTLAGATQQVLELAEHLDAPIITTYNGISSVPTNHSRCFGSLNRMGTALARLVVEESDGVLVLGNSLNGSSTSRWTLQLPEVVQIDIDRSVIGRHYPIRCAVVGDVGRSTDEIVRRLRQQGPASNHRAWMSELSMARHAWKQSIRDDLTANNGGAIKPQFVVQQIREALPPDGILSVDAGNSGIWTFLIDIYTPRSYMKPVGYGNMAFGMPAALGAKLGHPDKKVLALVGDGGLGMSLAELETLARERVGIACVVMNDSGYGNIRQEQLLKYGPRNLGVTFNDIDYASVARACGVAATRVTDARDLQPALTEALSQERPYLIDVVVDPSEDVWTYPAFTKPIGQLSTS